MVQAENTRHRPRPEDFADHRAYLKVMIGYLKSTRPQFSFRYFSRVAGFSSPNFLKLVAEGKRNLSPASVSKFADGLGLDPKERDGFETLVMLGQATTDAERNRYYARLRRGQSSKATRIEAAQFDVYSTWYALPIRELLSHPDFREDPAWIGRRLRPRVSAAEVRRALQQLQDCGLVTRDESGRLRITDTSISTGPQVRSLAVRNYHRALLGMASEGLDEISVERRDVSSLTLTLTPSQYQDVRERVARFRREILDLIDGQAGNVQGAREVHQLNFQLFPVTRKDDP